MVMMTPYARQRKRHRCKEQTFRTTLWWFLPYTDMNQPWIYMCSPSQYSSHLPPHPIPLGLPSALALSIRLMHPAWAGDLFHPRYYTCFSAILSEHPTLAFSHRVPKSVLYICVSFSIGLSLPSF